MKKALLFGILLVVVAFSVACGSSSSSGEGQSESGNEETEAKTYDVKMVIEEIPGSVQDMYAQKFKEVLEEKSNGRFTIDVIPVGQLGTAVEQAELLQNGAIEFAIVSPGTTGTLVPENQLFSLHFLFTDDMELNQEILDTSKALNEKLTEIYLDKNIKVLSYWTEGAMNWTSNKPLNKPEDFNGFKMRTMASPMIVASFEAYGANPTPVPYMEVYSGLQLNMIEGQENPLFAIEEMKFYEVQDYLTLSRHSLYVTSTAVNPEFFNSLSAEDQQLVLDTVEELKPYSFKVQNDLNKERLDNIKQDSDIEIVELSEAERDSFKEASKSVRDVYLEDAGEKGKEILELLEQEIQEAQN